MSRIVRNRTSGHVRSAKILISLRIRAGRTESSLGTFWIAKDAKFLPADKEDWSGCSDAQADWSLRWAHMSKGMFSNVVALMFEPRGAKRCHNFRIFMRTVYVPRYPWSKLFHKGLPAMLAK